MVKPVTVNVPSPVLIPAEGKPVVRSATVKIVRPIVTDAMPSGAVTVSVPVVVSVLSPTFTRPFSYTSACPVTAAPLPSTGVITGAPSVTPLMVMVSVVVLVSPSASVMV